MTIPKHNGICIRFC